MKRKEIIRRLNKVIDHLTVLEGARRLLKAGVNERVASMLDQGLATLHAIASDAKLRKLAKRNNKSLRKAKDKTKVPHNKPVDVNDGINALLGGGKYQGAHIATASWADKKIASDKPSKNKGAKPSKNKGGPKPTKNKQQKAKRKFSAAARRKIAAGQKRRWEVWRQEHKKIAA